MAFSKSTVHVQSFVQETQDYNSVPLERLILCITLAAGPVLLRLPCEERDGGLVPTIIFRDCPQTFQVFILSLLFACSTSAAAILHHDAYPRYSRLCRRCGAASLAVAVAALTWAIACTSLWWGAGLCAIWVVLALQFAALPWNTRIGERREGLVVYSASLDYVV